MPLPAPVAEPVSVTDARWQIRLAALQRLQAWSLRGRLSARNDRGGWAAGLQWRQGDADFDISLSGPLGQGLGRLYGQDGRVRLELPHRPAEEGDSADVLLEPRVGLVVPFDGLRYWLTGQPDPARPVASQELDALGRLTRLEQDGWAILYQHYAPLDGLEVPDRIEISHGSLRLKVIVDEWKLGSEA